VDLGGLIYIGLKKTQARASQPKFYCLSYDIFILFYKETNDPLFFFKKNNTSKELLVETGDALFVCLDSNHYYSGGKSGQIFVYFKNIFFNLFSHKSCNKHL
jgi:hypothetical protein